MGGDADLAAVGALLADRGRARMLLALADGRALPASRLAAEAGVAASTTSEHLAKLTAANLLSVERHGRFRYFRLAGPHVAELLETVAQFAPPEPIRSLRQDTRAQRLRLARTCYDHLAGRLGVALMDAMLNARQLSGGDGNFHPGGEDRLSAAGRDLDYELTDAGRAFLGRLGVTIPPRRKPVRYCVDWTEQRHHLAGAAGRGLLDRLLELDWIRRTAPDRAIAVTDRGRARLARHFALEWPPST